MSPPSCYNVLVTGGAGYVGSHCVRALCEAGDRVVVLDNLTAGHRLAVDRRAELVVGDLADEGVLDRLFAERRFDAVMHFAAFADVNESVREPLRYFQNNIVNSVKLLDAMRRHEVRSLVFSSSCAVYGVPPSVPITEHAPKNPISPYGRTKLAMEWAMEDSAAAWGLGATALRYFNAAGAAQDGAIGEDHDPETHLIPLVLRVALGRAAEIKVFGDDYPTSDGTCVRDYVHVEDLASVHRLALDKQQPGRFSAYNVGTGTGASVKQVIDAAREVSGRSIPATAAPRRSGDPPALFADSSKVRRELGWSPAFVDVRSIIETAWRWHHAHPDGFAD